MFAVIRTKSHFTTYVRRLFRNTHSSLHVNRLYDITLYVKYFNMYDKESEIEGKAIDDEQFLNYFIEQGFHKSATKQQIEDFIILQCNIRQLDFIIERNLDENIIYEDAKKEITYFEYKTDLKEKIPLAHNIYLSTMKSIVNQIETQRDYYHEKYFSKIKKQRLINDTFQYTIQKLKNFKLDATEFNLGKGSKERKEEVLQQTIDNNIEMLILFKDIFKDIFTDKNLSQISKVYRNDTYLHFILFEFKITRYITLSIKNNRSYKTKILYDLHLSLYEAYSNNIIVKYLHKIADKRTLKKYFSQDITEKKTQKHKQYLLILIDIPKNFIHLPLVLLGLDIGLDTNSVVKLIEVIAKNKNKNIKNKYLELMKKIDYYQLIEEHFVNFQIENHIDVYQ